MGLKAAAVAAVATLAASARAAQPGAAKPVPAPMRDLVWGKLNVLHTTDTHGWHGGHLQESQYSADWGDYVSFAHHMRQRADSLGVDLLLVDTGDRVEGNGLYDASDPKGRYYYDIYREQDIDIICSGNHELYLAPTSDREHQYTVPNFKSRYLASNLDYIEPSTGKRIPMAQRYRKFQTKNQKLNIVAFGFLFDFTGNANNTVVQPVAETVQQPWFQEAIREEPDLFVVIGHVGVQMREFKEIFEAIRTVTYYTPILFFGGHAHVRDATAYDTRSFAMASGRYFETIGWMSVDGPVERIARLEAARPADATVTAVDTLSFHRRYIDNNLLGMYHHTGLNETTFPTDHGRNVSAKIEEARKALDLDYAFGCAPQDYWMSRAPYPGPDSIYTWLEEQVLPDVAVHPSRKDVPRLVLANTGAIRFDIFKGAFTRDTTYIVSPFLSVLTYIPEVPYEAARKVIEILNGAGPIVGSGLMANEFMGSPEQMFTSGSIVYPAEAPFAAESDNGSGQKVLGGGSVKGGGKEPRLVQGYTTIDDIGDDGDDAVHANINFYKVPNCIQAEVAFPSEGEPETVDLVFLDFIKPWVLVALRFSGAKYSNEDVKPYVDGTFTELMAGWIKENWPTKC